MARSGVGIALSLVPLRRCGLHFLAYGADLKSGNVEHLAALRVPSVCSYFRLRVNIKHHVCGKANQTYVGCKRPYTIFLVV